MGSPVWETRCGKPMVAPQQVRTATRGLPGPWSCGLARPCTGCLRALLYLTVAQFRPFGHASRAMTLASLDLQKTMRKVLPGNAPAPDIMATASVM